MRSARVTPNTVATPSDYNALLNNSSGASRLLAHQMYGTIALPTNPTNTKTLTLDINGTNITITFVTSIGSTAGNVLIGASAAATAANLLQLLLNPTITNSTQVAIGLNTSTNVTLVNYINWSLTGTSVVSSSYNSTLYAPATSFSASTTVTGGSYTANTMALFVEPGVVFVNGTEVYFAGGVTGTVTAPVSHPRIDVLSMDNTGTLNWTTGTENASPSAPTYPTNQVPICELYNVVSETALYDYANQTSSQGYIYNDVRPFLAYPLPLGALPDNIIPAADATYNLGSSSKEWNNIYAKTGIYVNNIGVAIAKFGGTGADGALTVTSGTTTISASSAAVVTKNYTSVSITSTAYVQFTTPNTNGTVCIVKSQGNVTLTSSATPMLDASGMGAAGGASVSPSSGWSNGNGGSNGIVIWNAIGGGSGALQSSGASGGTLSVTPTYTAPTVGQILRYAAVAAVGAGGGSGGGAGSGGTSGAGGNGGGCLIVECAGAFDFTTSSGISVAGASGGNATDSGSTIGSGGGGGGGGFCLILYSSLTANSGTITVSGGNGGNNGASAGTVYGGGGGAGTAANGSISTSAGASSKSGGNGGNGTSLVAINTEFS